MNKIMILISVVILVILGFWLFSNDGDREFVREEIDIEDVSNVDVTNINNQEKIMNAVLHTNQGDITLEFFREDTPKTVENFVKLAEEGFYDGVKFHRVIEGFMIQGGDPLSKDEANRGAWGTGGPGYTFEDEIHDNNTNVIGTISMANAGPNTNGSQFFINVADNNFLDDKHTVFGKVTDGMDVVTLIEKIAVNESDQPEEDVIIESITLGAE